MSVPQVTIDFDQEALTAAVNEACASSEANRECSLSAPCPECQALAAAIKRRLQKAFLAGQMSMQRVAQEEGKW